MKKVFSFFLAVIVFVSVVFCSFGSVAVSDSNVYGLVISLATLAGFNFQPDVSNLTANQSWKNAIVFANNFLQSCYNSGDDSYIAFADELYTIAEELNTDVFQNKITVQSSLLTRFVSIVEDLYSINLTVSNGFVSDSLQVGSTWYGESLFDEVLASTTYNYYYSPATVYLSQLSPGFNLVSQRGVFGFGYYLSVDTSGTPQYILPLFKFGSTFFRTAVPLIPVSSETSRIRFCMRLRNSVKGSIVGFNDYNGSSAGFPLLIKSTDDSYLFQRTGAQYHSTADSYLNYYFIVVDSSGKVTSNCDAFGQNALFDKSYDFPYDFSENPSDLFLGVGECSLEENEAFISRFTFESIDYIDFKDWSYNVSYNGSLIFDNFIFNVHDGCSPNGSNYATGSNYSKYSFLLSRFAMFTFFKAYGFNQLPGTRNYSSYFLQINAEYLNGGGFDQFIDSDSFNMLVVTDPTLYTNQNTAGDVVNVPSADDIINMSPDDSTINPDGGSSGSGDGGSSISPPDIPELNDSTIGDYLSSFVSGIANLFSWIADFVSAIPQQVSYPVFGGFIAMICIGVVALIM